MRNTIETLWTIQTSDPIQVNDNAEFSGKWPLPKDEWDKILETTEAYHSQWEEILKVGFNAKWIKLEQSKPEIGQSNGRCIISNKTLRRIREICEPPHVKGKYTILNNGDLPRITNWVNLLHPLADLHSITFEIVRRSRA
jgi:hypothetical protein